MTSVRLQKFLAANGVAARRKAEEMIAAGRVTVNGAVASLGAKVDPQKDSVLVDGAAVELQAKKVYLKLYKPRGIVSSCVSQRGESTICDLIKDVKERLYPVGRLDQASEGLMLLTNDGELANKLMHPRYEHEKEYYVDVQSPMSDVDLKTLSSGIQIEDKRTLPAKVRRLGKNSFSITLKEGRKRQIRLMVEALGNKVTSLKRVRIKNITLGDLKAGQYMSLTVKELASLRG